jgi:hypothetical protein
MRLAVVLAILLFTVGCSCGFEKKAQPTVQPQPVVEQPTYQGVTQYDYKAGAPDELTNPVRDYNNPDSNADSGNPQPSVTASNGGSSTGWWGHGSYIPPIRRIVYEGIGLITKAE